MVVEAIGYIVLCVVVFSLPSYRVVTVLHVVSRCYSGYVHACPCSVVVVFVFVGAIFCESGNGFGLSCFSVSHGKCYCWMCVCSECSCWWCQLVSPVLLLLLVSSSRRCCCCRSCVFVVVGDGHGIYQAYSNVQCWIRVCAQAEELPFACWRFSSGGLCVPWR